jgi:hypothetical protein
MRRFPTLLAATSAVVVSLLGTASPASADAAGTMGITANCGGWAVVSAQYIKLTNTTQSTVGSIQLCKKPHYTGAYEYFARTEMYAPLPAGRMASGYVYYRNTYAPTGTDFRSCDMNTGVINPGETLCYTSNILDDQHSWDFRATGRAWVSSGGKWVLYAEGSTATIR